MTKAKRKRRRGRYEPPLKPCRTCGAPSVVWDECRACTFERRAKAEKLRQEKSRECPPTTPALEKTVNPGDQA